MNYVFLLGNLASDPSLQFSPNRVSYANFVVAVNRGKDKNGNSRGADFIQCVAFNHIAECIAKYFNKGSQIVVVGSWHTDTYEKDGVKRTSNKLVVNNFSFTRSSNYNAGGNTNPQSQASIPIDQLDNIRQDFDVPQVELNPQETFAFSADDDFGF